MLGDLLDQLQVVEQLHHNQQNQKGLYLPLSFSVRVGEDEDREGDVQTYVGSVQTVPEV